jgi:hypothetical protein
VPNRPGPWPPSYQTRALLDPPSLQGFSQQGVQWVRSQVYYPNPWIPQGNNIGTQPRDYVVQATNQPAGAEFIQTLQIDIPGIAFAICGGARRTDGAALLVGDIFGLTSFDVRFEHSNGDRLTTIAGLGSSILGSAGSPRLIGGPGWVFDRGSTCRIGITPHNALLQITVNVWILETRGPTNIGSLG